MSDVAYIFISSLVYVGLKAGQQQNVNHEKYKWVLPLSVLMSLCEFMIISIVAKESIWLFIPMGIGAGLGCMGAMWFHKYLRNNSSDLLQMVKDWIKLKVNK